VSIYLSLDRLRQADDDGVNAEIGSWRNLKTFRLEKQVCIGNEQMLHSAPRDVGDKPITGHLLCS